MTFFFPSFATYKGKWPRYCGWLPSRRNSPIRLIVIYPNFSPLSCVPSDRRPGRDGKTACVRVHKASHVYPLKGNLYPVNNLSSLANRRSHDSSPLFVLYDREYPLQQDPKFTESTRFKFSRFSTSLPFSSLPLMLLRALPSLSRIEKQNFVIPRCRNSFTLSLKWRVSIDASS